MYKWIFFGLPEKNAFLDTESAEMESARVKDAKPNKTLTKWIDEKMESLRVRYPEESRVQRLYLNINTITIGVILALCTAIRVQLVVMHVVLESLTESSDLRMICVSWIDCIVVVIPLARLVHAYPVIVGGQLLLRVTLFLFVGSIVQWKKNNTAVRKRLKKSIMRVQKRTKKIK